ncbi:unnamed protein product [Amoebophrya sp. A120]|nr:unnamed protein product [Amoebophrya sp. A120]|eukprot:GSA120T00002083001.1
MAETMLRNQGQMLGHAYTVVMYKRRDKYSQMGVPEDKHLHLDVVLLILGSYFLVPLLYGMIWWLIFLIILAVVGTAGVAVYDPERFAQVRAQTVHAAESVPTEQVLGAVQSIRVGFMEGCQSGTRASLRAE